MASEMSPRTWCYSCNSRLWRLIEICDSYFVIIAQLYQYIKYLNMSIVHIELTTYFLRENSKKINIKTYNCVNIKAKLYQVILDLAIE